MKTTLLSIGFMLLNITFNWLPSFDLLLVMLISIIIDFITGVIKASVLKVKRTSEGYRRTIVKFMQYGGAVSIGMLLSYLVEKNVSLDGLKTYINYFGDGLIIFIILIEITSILENIYAVDNTTPFSKYFIQPLLKILTIQIKNKYFNNESDIQR